MQFARSHETARLSGKCRESAKKSASESKNREANLQQNGHRMEGHSEILLYWSNAEVIVDGLVGCVGVLINILLHFVPYLNRRIG